MEGAISLRNTAHASAIAPESRLYRKSSGATGQLSYLGHVLTDSRHGLVVNVCASVVDGYAGRDVAKTMLGDVAHPDVRVTVGADKGYDTRGFSKACRDMKVTPHVAPTRGAPAAARSTVAPPDPAATP